MEHHVAVGSVVGHLVCALEQLPYLAQYMQLLTSALKSSTRYGLITSLCIA